MTFYLKQPRGFLNLHQLEESAKQRLICYDTITNDNPKYFPYDFEFLVEDSALDRTGHFLLRLLAYCNPNFRSQFIQNELKLLEIRLNSYDIQDVKQFLKRLMKHAIDNLKESNSDSLRELFVVFIDLSSSMLRKGYLRHVFGTYHDHTCNKNILKVPFHHCFSLVANRTVDLNHGYAEFTCGLWKQMLLSLFQTYITTALKEMKYSRGVDKALTDRRIKYILKEFSSHNSKVSRHSKHFDISKIREEMGMFPLCMLSLYKTLEKTNRLSHNERFDFSLYMKGIGVSLADSLKFWEMAYTKDHASCSKCTHNWQKNEKRYIYGIRHLYGLEGSRKNYQSRSCRYLQEKSLGPTEEGGCPFKHFDDENLRSVLKNALPNNLDEVEVMMYERNENPGVSCKLFRNIVFKTMTGKEVEKDVTVTNPVQYYLELRREIELELRVVSK
ncbi:hypothetical protein JTB14_013112 [Gonioctena quinquepunctata]|nr:hypothetical protein JTB14_013112 [Gonioctena quinquepunctata]